MLVHTYTDSALNMCGNDKYLKVSSRIHHAATHR